MRATIEISAEDIYELVKNKIAQSNPNLNIIEVSEHVNWVDQYFEGVRVVVEIVDKV